MNPTFQNQIKKEYRNKKILVTGASGYLSTNLIYALKDIDCKIVRLSRKGKLAPIEGRAEIIDFQGDIICKKTWERVLEQVDIIYHTAGQTSVYVSEEKPFDDMDSYLDRHQVLLVVLEICGKMQ